MNDKNNFFSAIQSGNIPAIYQLLQRNPDLVDAKDNREFTPLILASYFDKEDIVKVLVEKNANLNDTDASGNTALIGVSFKGSVNLVNYLIAQGADVNAKNSNGATALIFAAMYNQYDVVKILLKNKANKTIVDNDGKTALAHATEKKFTPIIDLLTN
ncbi:ankyrin [Tamlana nanhaiensis]|uniref:Ankyrin n=1 Tax=Neotamlana nanhaiensis TaxID=1382798 RepID=A0A0D7W3Q9_9FLAO|nr:ankyrin repeat domain-containing protein [Tamlana nanhaiensis]KJD33679.1 ankyrin [Tamlana nanhaiensis]